jgi:glycerophosphoryl diester phosphodiesterase
MKDTSFLKQNLIAHRGMHNIEKQIPENTIIAFKRAIEYNLLIELDVHILKDNSVVVFHDDNLKRMTGIDKNIIDTTYDEIKNLKLNKTNNHIPLFIDVLKLVNGKVPIIIELKYDAKYGKLEKEVAKILENYSGLYAIKSFNPMTVYWFKKNYPNIIRGQLVTDFKDKKINIVKKIFLKNMLFNFISKPDFISFDVKALPNKKIEKLKSKMIILGWTVNAKKTMLYSYKYCDNLICENIENLIDDKISI